MSREIPAVEEQRRRLGQHIEAGEPCWRILFLGAAVHGVTDVVSCLRRALSNLGHTVLPLSVSDHPDLVEELPRTITGRGPVFLRGGALHDVVEAFRPQVILCVAGGLCWRQSDADRLRERGILLLGMTLSDPDVLDTVADHVDRFDYHVTNSLAAVGEYRARGIRNTRWFPFGIDAGFAAAEVAPEPRMAAEVICIGHAVDRPDRHRVMARLAREFKVRVYGLGWPMAGAGPVSGWSLLEAARSGLIHVSFPATRAGHVNVKCGVFESVAAGGVVCTARFDEMRHFFEYGEQVVGFEDEEELVVAVRRLLGDRGLIEAVRRKAFQRLVRDHLYEHRWRDWFQGILQDLCSPPERLSPRRTEVLRQGLGAAAPLPRKVVIAGFYGARNLGDELILRSIHEGLRRRTPGIELHVAAEEPRTVERLHALPAFSRTDLASAAAELAGASGFILGGGGLWHDYTFLQAGGSASLLSNARLSLAGFGRLVVLARLLNCRVLLFGLGVGPLDHPGARNMAAFLAGQAEWVSVRDQESQSILSSLQCFSGQVDRYADPVFALPMSPAPMPVALAELAARHPLIAVNLRRWSALHPGFPAVAARALERLARARKAALVGLPMQDGDGADLAALREVFELVPDEVPRFLVEWSADPGELTSTLTACRLVLAMRLHACILAFRAGVPVVGLAYDQKVRNLFAAMDQEERALAPEVSQEDLAGCLHTAWEDGGRLPGRVVRRVQEMEASAQAGLDALADRLEGCPQILVPEPIPRRLEGWPPDDDRPSHQAVLSTPDVAVALSAASVRAGSVLRLDAHVHAQVRRDGPDVEFQIGCNAPQEGDFAILEVPIDCEKGGGLSALFSVLSPYCRPNLAGRVVYQILLDGHPVLEEDVAMWDSVNTVRLVWSASGVRSLLGVRILARRDCEPWNWGRAGRVIVKGLSRRSLPGKPALLVLPTSPYSRLLGAAEPSTEG